MTHIYIRKRNKLPIFFWYLLGSLQTTFVWSVCFSLICALTSPDIFSIAFFEALKFSFLIFFIEALIWRMNTYRDAVSTIIIDDDKQEITIEYHTYYTFFIQKKTCVIQLCNLNCSYDKYNVLYHFMKKISPLGHFEAVIGFSDIKNHATLVIFSDVGGWTIEQVEMVYNKLLEYKNPIETPMGPRFSKKTGYNGF